MQQTIESCGLWWYLPKFNWAILRIRSPHGENMLRGCLLTHPEYKKRRQAVKDLQSVFVRFGQAARWFHQYDVKHNPGLLRKWLEYLFALNLEQFNADLWRAVVRAKGRAQELSPWACQQAGNVAYSYDVMKRLFLADSVASPPHLVTGMKGAFRDAGELLDFIFLEDERKRAGWRWKPFRQILARTRELLETEIGEEEAAI